MSPYEQVYEEVSEDILAQKAELAELNLEFKQQCDEFRRIFDERRANRSIAPSKYHVAIKDVWIDVYDVLHAFSVTNPADQHAIKKMLMPGKRGHKDGIQDRREAIASLERAIQLEGDNV